MYKCFDGADTHYLTPAIMNKASVKKRVKLQIFETPN